MNLKILCIAIMVMLVCSGGVSIESTATDTIKVHTVDYKLFYGRERNNDLKHRLLSFNDTTYMSVRDAAAMFGREVMWNPDNKEINIVERYKKEDIIANKETALTMGKALLKEYFADEVKDESVYGV